MCVWESDCMYTCACKKIFNSLCSNVKIKNLKKRWIASSYHSSIELTIFKQQTERKIIKSDSKKKQTNKKLIPIFRLNLKKIQKKKSLGETKILKHQRWMMKPNN